MILRRGTVNARFIAWLAEQSIAEERINHISNMSSLALSDIMRLRSADGFNDIVPDWFVPGGAIPIEIYEEEGFPKNEFPDGIIPLDFVMSSIEQKMYLNSLGFRLACQKATENTGPDVLTIDEYRLFHQYLTLGAWIIHEITKSFRIPFARSEFRSIGNTVRISLFREIRYEQRVW